MEQTRDSYWRGLDREGALGRLDDRAGLLEVRGMEERLLGRLMLGRDPEIEDGRLILGRDPEIEDGRLALGRDPEIEDGRLVL